MNRPLDHILTWGIEVYDIPGRLGEVLRTLRDHSNRRNVLSLSIRGQNANIRAQLDRLMGSSTEKKNRTLQEAITKFIAAVKRTGAYDDTQLQTVNDLLHQLRIFLNEKIHNLTDPTFDEPIPLCCYPGCNLPGINCDFEDCNHATCSEAHGRFRCEGCNDLFCCHCVNNFTCGSHEEIRCRNCRSDESCANCDAVFCVLCEAAGFELYDNMVCSCGA